MLELNMKCTTDSTMDVTSDDLILDPAHPEVRPINYKDPGDSKPITIVKMRKNQVCVCVGGGGGRGGAARKPGFSVTWGMTALTTTNSARHLPPESFEISNF